ncbi:ABC transporter permease [Spiroplasma tabanidicola]|nr:ABC transporter permease [Spiroplasma tabanidicola]
MRIQKPFFKNAFKNILKNKIQFITVIILIFISSLVFTMCYSATSRINKSYNEYSSQKESNLHDFVADFTSTSYISNEDNEDKINFKKLSDPLIRDNLVLTYIKNKLQDTNNSFVFDRVEARQFSLSTNKTLKVVILNPEQKVDKFVVEEGMDLNTWTTYSKATNNLSLKWAYIDRRFADYNNIKLNDIIRLQDDKFGSSILVKNSQNKDKDFDKTLKEHENEDISLWMNNTPYNELSWFQVVGFGSSADFVTPIVNSEKPLPNYKEEALVYVNPLNFGITYKYYETVFANNEFSLNNYGSTKIWYSDNQISNYETLKVISDADKEIYFVGKFANEKYKANSIEYLNNLIESFEVSKEIGLKSNYINALNENAKIFTKTGDSNYSMGARTSTFPFILIIFNVVSYVLIAIILGIGIVILIAQLKLQLEKAFGQMGVMISLGYKKIQLILSNSIYAFIIALVGGTIGYICGYFLQFLIITVFDKFFAIQIQQISFNLESFIISIFGIFAFLEFVTLITCIYMFNKNTVLEMINYEQRSATTRFNLFFKKLFIRRTKNFNSKFSGAILSSSVLKLFAVLVSMFVAATMTTASIIMPHVLKENQKYIYSGDEYDNKVTYYSPIYNDPVSFYKTYNPESTNKNYDSLDAKNLIDSYLKNNISSKFFNPSNDLGELNDMSYKNIDLDYLKSKDLYLQNNSQNSSDLLITSLTGSLWPDIYRYVKPSWLNNKKEFMDVLFNANNSRNAIEDLENMRLFYLKYKHTIGLNIRREGYFVKRTSLLTSLASDGGPNNDLISANEFASNSSIPISVNIEKDGSIMNDEVFQNSLYKFVNSSNYMSESVVICGPIYNWIVAYFRANLQQIFLQGIYTSLPSNIRDIMLKEFEKDNGSFNMSFGTTPFNQENEELGTYLNSELKNIDFKVYGINQNGLQKLYDNNSNDIKAKLVEKDSIIINETLAKKLKLKVGQTVDINHIIEYLEKDGQELGVDSWNTNKINAQDSEGYTSSKNIYKNSVLNSKKIGWTNSKMIQDDVDEQEKDLVYYSRIDLSSDSMVSPTSMSKQIKKGAIKKKVKKINKEYKVVGIANQYGVSKAWIDNETANEQAQYNKTKPLLFSLFIKEWSNPKSLVSGSEEQIFVNKLKEFNNTSTLFNSNYENFVNWTNSNQDFNKYLTLFNNEYPIFNYKNSNDKSFSDLSKGITTIQRYGDYTIFGLKGGKVNGANQTSYSAFSQSPIESVWQYDAAIEILSRIEKTLNSIIFTLLPIILIISFIVILLTINSVIAKNQKIIAMMKILGYSKVYISRLFIGIYIPPAILGSILGFVAGWFFLKLTLYNAITSILLPFNFYIWYLIVGGFGTFVLYLISVAISWNALRRVNMLIAVQGG